MYRTKKSKEMSNITNLSQILCSIKNNKLGTVDGTQINEAEGGTLIMGLRSDDYLWERKKEFMSDIENIQNHNYQDALSRMDFLNPLEYEKIYVSLDMKSTNLRFSSVSLLHLLQSSSATSWSTSASSILCEEDLENAP